MGKDKRKGWLAELKVGSAVFIKRIRGDGTWTENKAIIFRITPTGIIKAHYENRDSRLYNMGGYSFNPDGQARQSSPSYYKPYLVPYAP